jgi:hypothetical protein
MTHDNVIKGKSLESWYTLNIICSQIFNRANKISGLIAHIVLSKMGCDISLQIFWNASFVLIIVFNKSNPWTYFRNSNNFTVLKLLFKDTYSYCLVSW